MLTMNDEGYYRKKLDEIAPLLADKDRHISILEETQRENEIEIEPLQGRVVELEDIV